jgi:hypothetical protein
MAFVSMTSACVRCGRLFFYNPLRVPSVVVNGQREPLCRPCVEWANRERAAKGLATWPIHHDAYEAVDEQEIAWPDD